MSYPMCTIARDEKISCVSVFSLVFLFTSHESDHFQTFR